MNYFNLVLENLYATTDFVLIYEQACCIHEMLKEIDYWLKMSNSASIQNFSSGFGGMSNNLGSLRRANKNDLLNFNDGTHDS